MKKKDKVREHCHYNGKYRGAAQDTKYQKKIL